eukprot:gene10100-8288_t
MPAVPHVLPPQRYFAELLSAEAEARGALPAEPPARVLAAAAAADGGAAWADPGLIARVARCSLLMTSRGVPEAALPVRRAEGAA